MDAKEIDEYVEAHREEAVEFLQKMLRTPSPTGQEYAVSQVIKESLEKDQLPVELHALDPQRPNVYVEWVGNPQGTTFLFNGHEDVFPPSEKAKDPWSGRIEGDTIYGCGSADMQTGLSAGIMTLKFLKRSGFQPNGILKLSCDCDEEQGGKYGVLYLMSEGLLDADFGVCMEASEDLVITDSDGRIGWEVIYRSEPWHAGMRSTWQNPIAKAQRAIARLYEYDDYLKKNRYFNSRDGGAILTITEISAGNQGKTSNVNPTECHFSIDRRYTKGETIESATMELKKILDELKHEDPAMDYELKTLVASPRLIMDENSPCIAAAMDAYKQYIGPDVRLGRRCGGGDTAKITQKYGFPLPQFGPGRFDQLCVPDEHVSIQEYLNFIKIYMYMVFKLVGEKY